MKTAALVISAATLLLLIPDVDYRDVGIYIGCPTTNRIAYNFFHANAIHAILNVWCFLSCVFLANTNARHSITALAIAAAAPETFLAAKPTIGLSAVCFALLGMIMPYARDKLKYNLYIGMAILIPFLVMSQSVANALHAYAYMVGAITESAIKFSQKPKNTHKNGRK